MLRILKSSGKVIDVLFRIKKQLQYQKAYGEAQNASLKLLNQMLGSKLHSQNH